ncbi:InlB B-repeat-containing protein [Flammeovirga sp. EKP202]|uniref:InlB B-repeat-containing protein n=1 Tax=Flammeovirga sp. EKP202 TaxID=2770592 RepID=UPI00165FBEDC|nr:InlB B-repeat-containing protein [Flammeovirga sp. EKP202]MBD0402824.1 InlB B-repeat-containing protein [Flammeovirga sp. EKP202]
MKKRLTILNKLLFLSILGLIASCDSQEDQSILHEVKFDPAGGSAVESQLIIDGDTVTKPNDPIMDGSEFVTWLKNDMPYDFGEPVKEEFTLTATWDAIYTPIVNPNATPYITEVLNFSPAPGQFLNKVDDQASVVNIIGDSYQFISLGTFGGNVTFKFDHSIMNGEGDDIAIYGNSFEDNSEPGIVMVCQDLNHNGIADDDEPWYELAGSEYYKDETTHNYSITYYRPGPEEDQHIIKYKEKYGDTENEGEMDFTPVKPFHEQPMFPTFYEEDEITFTGTKLKSNTWFEDMGEWKYYHNPAYDWGYADNRGYENEGILRSADLFDISNAVDENGEKVELIAIDFVKVYTATTEIAHWLGERSPEIVKAADISLLPTNE